MKGKWVDVSIPTSDNMDFNLKNILKMQDNFLWLKWFIQQEEITIMMYKKQMPIYLAMWGKINVFKERNIT